MPPPALLIPWLSLAAAAPGCGGAQAPDERLVCANAALQQQQAQVQRLYAQALQALPPAQRTREEQRQGLWLSERAACPHSADPRGCLAAQLSRRAAELNIRLEQVPVFAAVTYQCPQAPLHAAYYHSEPAAVRLTYQGEDVIAFSAPSGSGARYAASGVELWEHQGVARFTWKGAQVSCPKE